MSTSKTLLLVDDDIGHRTMLKANLADEYKILEADDGDMVLAMLREQHVDLILLDLKQILSSEETSDVKDMDMVGKKEVSK